MTLCYLNMLFSGLLASLYWCETNLVLNFLLNCEFCNPNLPLPKNIIFLNSTQVSLFILICPFQIGSSGLQDPSQRHCSKISSITSGREYASTPTPLITLAALHEPSFHWGEITDREKTFLHR